MEIKKGVPNLHPQHRSSFFYGLKKLPLLSAILVLFTLTLAVTFGLLPLKSIILYLF